MKDLLLSLMKDLLLSLMEVQLSSLSVKILLLHNMSTMEAFIADPFLQ